MTAAATNIHEVREYVDEGLTYAQIAERIGCSVSTVKRYGALIVRKPRPTFAREPLQPNDDVTPEIVSDMIMTCMTAGGGQVVLPADQVRAALDLIEQAFDYEEIASTTGQTVRELIKSNVRHFTRRNMELQQRLREVMGNDE